MKLPDTHHFQSRYFISIETEDSEEVTSMSLSSQSARQTGPVNLEISQFDLEKYIKYNPNLLFTLKLHKINYFHVNYDFGVLKHIIII